MRNMLRIIIKQIVVEIVICHAKYVYNTSKFKQYKYNQSLELLTWKKPKKNIYIIYRLVGTDGKIFS